MANHHLRNQSLSLKAKGLLSLMLSLPEDWDYTTRGLACICKDGVDSIGSAIRELEAAGYVKRRRLRSANGQLADLEYTILEKPEISDQTDSVPQPEKPDTGNPDVVNPDMEKPGTVSPRPENPPQLNIQESNTHKSNNNLSTTQSFYLSGTKTDRRTDIEDERNRIKHQIEYDWLLQQYRQEQVDELLEIMVEVAVNKSHTIRIGRDAEYPTTYVRERLNKLTVMHMERILEALSGNRTEVRNTKAYLLATLFNAISTMDHHYTMQYNYDFGDSL